MTLTLVENTNPPVPLLTTEEVREALVDVVLSKGVDYIYPEDEKIAGSCVYRTHDGDPSCLIGHLLVAVGATNLIEEATSAFDLTSNKLTDSTTAFALTQAQSAQDDGRSWGYALSEFDRVIEEAFVPTPCDCCDNEVPEALVA